MTRFALYDIIKEWLSTDDQPLPLWKLAVAGSIAGSAGGGKHYLALIVCGVENLTSLVAGNPADVVLVRMKALVTKRHD